jgi:hypothetical protein
MVMMAVDQRKHINSTVPKSLSSVNELDHKSSKAGSDPMSRHLQASPARGCREN